ncbi:ATPase involved in DNA repair [Nitrincola lacisaponensis]|uniref:ATPase involved in DNA repair n=1 Tax=Nitrincola lacisaponensis TaxID=267850 RepID=A0A063Y488_9GAMM|nr:DUF2802 domain-containing protein [Nitrincola lacisaponensis]KDE39581.1 ATPase involved in DNA repair [Nitrincola lacisaponensis]
MGGAPGVSFLWLAVGLLALVSLAAVLVTALLWVRIRRQEKRHQVLINVLRNEIQGMTGSSIGMGKRLKTVEQKLDIAVEKQHELENRDPGVLAYNQAAKLMEMGAGVDDLVRSCGIGRPEAELMALLHRELQDERSLTHKH